MKKKSGKKTCFDLYTVFFFICKDYKMMYSSLLGKMYLFLLYNHLVSSLLI